MGLFFADKPDVPELEKLELGKEQKKAIQSNIAAMPEAEKMVSKANLFSQQQIDQMLARVGGGDLLSSGAGQIEKMIAGEVPLSDQQQQQLNSIAGAFGGGYAGGSAMGKRVARDFGLQQMDLTMKGLSSAESWMRTTASLYEPSMMSLSSMFISPMQQYQTDNEQNLQQFQREWMGNQIEAMPSPLASGALSMGLGFIGGLMPSLGGKGGGPSGGGLGGAFSGAADAYSSSLQGWNKGIAGLGTV